jgi:hypothetical protein
VDGIIGLSAIGCRLRAGIAAALAGRGARSAAVPSGWIAIGENRSRREAVAL